jgi:hypothetical protein
MNSELSIVDLRNIVNNHDDRISGINDDLGKLYAHIGIKNSPSQSRAVVKEFFNNKIKQSFTSPPARINKQCRNLVRTIICEHVLHGTPLNPHLSVIDHIRDLVRGEYPKTDASDDNWTQAIDAAMDSLQVSPYAISDDVIPLLNSRDYAVASAAKRLAARGYNIDLSEGRVKIDEETEAGIANKIESLIVEVGGSFAIETILRLMNPTYDNAQGRYHVVRRVNIMGTAQPALPLGHLFQIAIKHFPSKPKTLIPEVVWQVLQNLSVDYAAALDSSAIQLS